MHTPSIVKQPSAIADGCFLSISRSEPNVINMLVEVINLEVKKPGC
jgi:hypothetical protein